MFKKNQKTKIAIFISGFISVFYFQNNVEAAEYNPNARERTGLFKDSKFVGTDAFKPNEKKDTDSYTRNRENLSSATSNHINYDNGNIALYSINNKSAKNRYKASSGKEWIENHRQNYQVYDGKNSKDENYLTRQTGNGKRVVYSYGEKDAKNQRGNFDSTYIIPDFDYKDNNDNQRIFDCSKYTTKFYEVVEACPTGMTVADNNYDSRSSNGVIKGFNIINAAYNSHNVDSSDYYGAFDKFIYDENNKKGWQQNYNTSSCNSLEPSSIHSYCSIWNNSTLDSNGALNGGRNNVYNFKNGVSLYESTIVGKGLHRGVNIEGCLKMIKPRDPNTYTSKKQSFYDHNCAIACPTKPDDGALFEVKVDEDCAKKADKFGNKFYRTNDDSTKSEKYERGTAQREYVKEYIFKNSKGKMKNPLNMNGPPIHSCDLWRKKLSKQTRCIADANLVEGLLTTKSWKGPEPEPPTGGGIYVGPIGCAYNGVNCAPTPPPPPPPPSPPKKEVVTLKGISSVMTNEVQQAANNPIQRNEDQQDKVINFDGKEIETPFNIYQYVDPNDNSKSFHFVVDPTNPNKYFKVRYDSNGSDDDDEDKPIRYWRQIH